MKQTIIKNKYTIQSDGQGLVTSILKNDYNRLTNSGGVLLDNFLNHWLDPMEVENQVDLETRLDNDEYTIADFKSSVPKMDLETFKDQMIPVMKAVLKFAYYQELGKQWSTPLNPLNLIYSEDANGNGQIKAFYRDGAVQNEISGQFLDDVVKLVTYLFIPEEEDSVEDFPNLTGQDYLDKISGDPQFIDMYGDDGDRLIDFIFDCLSPHNNDAFYSVKDILENVGGYNEIAEVEDPNNKGAFEEIQQKPVNLNDYQNQYDPDLDENPDDDFEDDPEELEDGLDENEDEQPNPNKKKKIKRKPQKQNNSNKANKKKSKLPAVLITGVILGGLGFAGYKMMAPKQEQPQQVVPTSSSSSTNDPLDNKYFADGVQKAGAQDYASASKDFNKFFNSGHNQSELTNQQISTVFSAYLKDGDYQDILDNIGSEKTATALINYLQAKNDTDSIKKLDSDYPIVKFAQADVNNDQAEMISLANKVDLKNNEKYQDDLCKAFADQDKLEDGKSWAETQSDPQKLKDAIKGHAHEANKRSAEDIDKVFS